MQQNQLQKRSLSQNFEGLSEYQTVNHKQSVKVKKLKEKVTYLQDFLAKVDKLTRRSDPTLSSFIAIGNY